MNTSKFSWKTGITIVLSAFFFVGAIGNIFVSEEIAADYLRWGYPAWFHFVTGSLECIAALLLLKTSTRLWGAVLGSFIMVSALITVILHREYMHAIAPLVVLIISLMVAWIYKRRG